MARLNSCEWGLRARDPVPPRAPAAPRYSMYVSPPAPDMAARCPCNPGLCVITSYNKYDSQV